MDPRILRAGTRMAVLILLLALVTLPFQRWGSAESVVSVLAAGVGLLFVAGIALLARRAAPRPPGDSRRGKGYNQRSTRRGR